MGGNLVKPRGAVASLSAVANGSKSQRTTLGVSGSRWLQLGKVLATGVAVGMILCTAARSCRVIGTGFVDAPPCFGETDQAAIKSSLVGRRVTKLLSPATLTGGDETMVDDNDGPDETAHFCAFCDGTITAAVGNDGSYTAEFDTPAGSRSVLLSASEVEEAMQSHTCLARMLKREHAKAENAAQHRAFVPTGPR